MKQRSPIEPSQEPSPPRPEFFRPPGKGGDPYFGLSRSWYYAAEKAGLLALVRIRQRGKLRGVTLVPYEAVRKVVQDAAASE